MNLFKKAAFKEFKPDIQSMLQNVDSKSQASGKPFFVNKEAAETLETKPKVEDIKLLVGVFNNLLVSQTYPPFVICLRQKSSKRKTMPQI